jgi:hypothetical protein
VEEKARATFACTVLLEAAAERAYVEHRDGERAICMCCDGINTL